MKIKNLLLAIVAISLLVSCEKDKENDSSISKNSHRIKQIIYNSNGGLDYWKEVFTYKGEKLVKITKYIKYESRNWNEISKTEITYSDDNAIATWYDKESGSWEIDKKYEYIIQNGLMMEEFHYLYEDDTWVEYWKWTYQYSGSNISAWQSYYYYNQDGTVKQNYKGEYIYQNNKLSESRRYKLDESDIWYQYDNKIFTYDGNNLINQIDYDLDESDNWGKAYKSEFLYSGDKVTQKEYFYWNSGDSQWVSKDVESYTYDSNGYLIEKLDEDGDIRTYEYEEGNGNAKLFWYYPEELANGEPTLKSASITRKRKYIPYYQRLKNK